MGTVLPLSWQHLLGFSGKDQPEWRDFHLQAHSYINTISFLLKLVHSVVPSVTRWPPYHSAFSCTVYHSPPYCLPSSLALSLSVRNLEFSWLAVFKYQFASRLLGHFSFLFPKSSKIHQLTTTNIFHCFTVPRPHVCRFNIQT